MEESPTIDRGMNPDLTLTNAARSYLMETAKWARFLAIVGFVMIGFLVIAAFFIGCLMSSVPEFQEIPGFAGMGGAFFTIMYLVLATLYFFPTLYLYRFATRTKSALESKDSEALGGGLENLKSTFKYLGILMLILLGFYALIFVFSIVAGLATAF